MTEAVKKLVEGKYEFKPYTPKVTKETEVTEETAEKPKPSEKDKND